MKKFIKYSIFAIIYLVLIYIFAILFIVTAKAEIIKPNKCKSFANLIKNKKVKNYIDDRKPNKQTLKNLKVTILYINHDYETRDGLSSSLVKLWEDLFNYIGVEDYEVIKQLDIK